VNWTTEPSVPTKMHTCRDFFAAVAFRRGATSDRSPVFQDGENRRAEGDHALEARRGATFEKSVALVTRGSATTNSGCRVRRKSP